MEKNQSLNLIQQQLSIYGAQVYNYRGTEFIGVKNPYSDNNMAFTFSEEEFAMGNCADDCSLWRSYVH